MQFVSFQQMIADIRTWSAELPSDLIAVAGVLRSGILPAVHLALHRNIHLVTVSDLVQGKTPWQGPLRRGVPAKNTGRILVLDDTVHTGKTLHAIRKRLPHRNEIFYGALYGQPPFPPHVDHVFRPLPQPRCFEWNLFHSNQMAWAGLDMDGVLCEDWTGREEDSGPKLIRYQHHLCKARPCHLPTYRVMAIVTSRLEKYRSQTVEWLHRHGVKFSQLVMSPHPTAAARRAAGDHAARKAEWYAAHPQARLFIESHVDQARIIAKQTGRPVLCTDQMQMYS